MTAVTTGSAGFVISFFASEDELRLVNKLCKHVSHCQGKSDKDKYFLK